MVDIRREGHSQRSAPQKIHTSHLRRRAHRISRKRSGWDGGDDKTHPYLGEMALAKHLVACATWTWEGQKTQAQLSLRLCGVPENLNLSGLDLGSACNQGPASDSSQQSNLEPEQCRQGKHTHREQGKPLVAETLRAHASVICLQCPSLPTARLNK